MKEPERIPLTDSPRSKVVKKIPLESNNPYPTFEDLVDWYNENYRENNSESISELESDPTN